jgi:hypothetical protein
MDDLEAFHQALRKYRESSGDVREFADLPADVQESIVHNAQVLKKRVEEEKRG